MLVLQSPLNLKDVENNVVEFTLVGVWWGLDKLYFSPLRVSKRMSVDWFTKRHDFTFISFMMQANKETTDSFKRGLWYMTQWLRRPFWWVLLSNFANASWKLRITSFTCVWRNVCFSFSVAEPWLIRHQAHEFFETVRNEQRHQVQRNFHFDRRSSCDVVHQHQSLQRNSIVVQHSDTTSKHESKHFHMEIQPERRSLTIFNFWMEVFLGSRNLELTSNPSFVI